MPRKAVERTLTCRVISYPSGLDLYPGAAIPALSTAMSIRGTFFVTASANCLTDAKTLMSSWKSLMLEAGYPVLSQMVFLASSPRERERTPKMSDEAPRAANLTADSNPRPTFAPVIRIVLSANDVVGSFGGFRAPHLNMQLVWVYTEASGAEEPMGSQEISQEPGSFKVVKLRAEKQYHSIEGPSLSGGPVDISATLREENAGCKIGTRQDR